MTPVQAGATLTAMLNGYVAGLSSPDDESPPEFVATIRSLEAPEAHQVIGVAMGMIMALSGIVADMTGNDLNGVVFQLNESTMEQLVEESITDLQGGAGAS